jgi:hypothetical protein
MLVIICLLKTTAYIYLEFFCGVNIWECTQYTASTVAVAAPQVAELLTSIINTIVDRVLQNLSKLFFLLQPRKLLLNGLLSDDNYGLGLSNLIF